MTDNEKKTHHRFAVAWFNRAWELIDKAERTPQEEDEMLAAAFASRLHWNAIGTDQNRAVGDWQIGHVASHLGLGDLALRFSTRCLDTTTANAWGDLYLASAHEGVARAHATLGDKAERDRHADLCRTALDAIADPEDRAVIERQLATVPKV